MSGDWVVITEHGGGDPRRLPVAGVAASWELSNTGTFSAFARVGDLHAAGIDESLAGRWLDWRDPRGLRWNGVLSAGPVRGGLVELVGEGFGALLAGRVLDAWDAPSPGQAAGLALRVLRGAGGEPDAAGFLRPGWIDEGGVPIDLLIGGQDALDDLLPQLVDDAGLEWWVDTDRRLHLGRRIGRDQSATLRLVEGRHVVDYKLARDAWATPPSELLEIENAAERARRAAQDLASGRRRRSTARLARRRISVAGGDRDAWRPGRRAAGIEQRQARPKRGPAGVATSLSTTQPTGVGTHALLVPADEAVPLPTTPMELTLADVDHCWARLRVGDVARVLLGSAGPRGFSGTFRALVRGFDAASSVVVVAGEALADGVRVV